MHFRCMAFAFALSVQSNVNSCVTSFDGNALLRMYLCFAFPSVCAHIFSGRKFPVKIWGSCKKEWIGVKRHKHT